MPISSKTAESEHRGSRYGQWTVLSGPHRDGRRRKCLCLCSCGEERLVDIDSLRSGRSKRCKTCHNSEIALKDKTPYSDIGKLFAHVPKSILWRLRRIVKHAIRRCINQEDEAYCDYGQRGIKVLFVSDIQFIEHLITLTGYDDPLLVIDRINNDGHYEAGNLRFTTWSESNYNRRLPNKMSQRQSTC